MQLLKTDHTHKTISFCVLTPNIVDRNGDMISEDEIIKTAHNFMENISEKYLNIDHKDGTNIDKNAYSFVENFIAPTDIIVGENIVKKGSWYVGIKFHNDELYTSVINGDFVGVSMEGYFIK